MGPSGSGKTLLLRAIADLDPSEGNVSLGDENKESVAAPEWRRRISYVAAEPGWWAATPADHFGDWSAAHALAEALLLSPDIGAAPVSFAVADGACLAVMGPSGSGKTLLLRAIADLDPSEGNVSLGDENKESVAAPESRNSQPGKDSDLR